MDTLQIEMLNGFKLSSKTNSIGDSENRSRKIWLLLAYFIWHRNRVVSSEELYHLLWADEEKSDMQNSLRVMLHRLRTMLNDLYMNADDSPEWIVREKQSSKGSKNAYRWNPAIHIHLDTDDFQNLIRQGESSTDKEEKITLYRTALALYKEDFLYRLSDEPWARDMAVTFRNLYIDTTREQINLLSEKNQHQECISLARAALKTEPYSESLWYSLMQSYLALNLRQEAIETYEKVREMFIGDLGILPAEEIRRLYYEAIREEQSHILPIDVLYDEIQKKDTKQNGALLCDFDFFVTVFHSQARLIARTGAVVHLAVLTAVSKDGTDLPQRSAEYIMDCLLTQTCTQLRRGDTVSRCSGYQFAILLPLANYENACMVCERIIKSYYRKYPHSPAEIRYAVKTIENEF